MPETLLNKGKIKKSLFKRLFIMSTGNEKDAFPAQAPKLRQRKKPRTRIACRGSRLVRVFITNLKSILKIRLKTHMFPRTFADLLPLCYDYNTKH